MGHCVAGKEEGEQVISMKVRHNYKITGRHGDQVVLQVPRGVEYKRNLQHIKPLEIPDIEDNSETESGPPDEATSPECLDHKPFQQHVPPEATPANTLCHSGRIRQPPRKVAD